MQRTSPILMLCLLCGCLSPSNSPVEDSDGSFAKQLSAVREGSDSEIKIDSHAVSDAEVRSISDLDGLSTIVLDEGAITDEGFQCIVRCSSIQHLRLRKSEITDEGLKSLEGHQSLQILNLPHARITADGLQVLQSIPNLHQLRMGSRLATNAICEPLSKLQLRSLHLIDIPVDDTGLALLAQIESLESLYLDGSAVTDQGWDALFQTRPDLHVHMDQRHHDRDPNKHE